MAFHHHETAGGAGGMTPSQPLAMQPHSSVAATSPSESHGWYNEDCVSTAASSLLFFVAGATFIAAAVAYVLADVMMRKSRLFHYLIATSLAITSLAFLTQSYGLGVMHSASGTVDQHGGHQKTRCLFAARFIDLALTFPLILTAFGLMAGAHLAELIAVGISSALMFITQLIGGWLPQRRSAWLLFIMSALLWLPVVRHLINAAAYDVRKIPESAAMSSGPTTSRLRSIVGVTAATLLTYLTLHHVLYLLSHVIHVLARSTFTQVMSIADLAVKLLTALFLLHNRDVIEHRLHSLRNRLFGGGSGTSITDRLKHAGGIGSYGSLPGEATSQQTLG